MAEVTFLNNWIVAKFILPFLLIFFILFAILEKTKVLGDNKHQLNTFVSFVVGLIFVGAVFPKEVVGNLILFLTVAMIVVFVALLLWGFVSGKTEIEGWVKKLAGIVLVAAVIIAIFWAVGLRVEFLNNFIDFLFYSAWSGTFWTNVVFVGVVAIAIAVVLGGTKSSG